MVWAITIYLNYTFDESHVCYGNCTSINTFCKEQIKLYYLDYSIIYLQIMIGYLFCRIV